MVYVINALTGRWSEKDEGNKPRPAPPHPGRVTSLEGWYNPWPYSGMEYVSDIWEVPRAFNWAGRDDMSTNIFIDSLHRIVSDGELGYRMTD